MCSRKRLRRESSDLLARLRTGFGAGEGAAVDRGDPTRLLAVRARGGHEDRFPVVAELLDALPDVGEGTVTTVLGWCVVVRPREPAPRKLLDRGDVDDPVVQERLELRCVPGQERPVRGNGVARQRRSAAV